MCSSKNAKKSTERANLLPLLHADIPNYFTPVMAYPALLLAGLAPFFLFGVVT